MGFYNFIDSHILLPVADMLYGSSVHTRIKEFRGYDSMSQADIISLQNKKLQRLIRHCYDSVPYYTKLFDKLGIKPEDIKTREDLQKLPILTKQIIRDNYDDLF